ncbi:unnamed protein product [Rhizophagus irregularis]|nr:unnamed protein product [Rhizophagus irregularis]
MARAAEEASTPAPAATPAKAPPTVAEREADYQARMAAEQKAAADKKIVDSNRANCDAAAKNKALLDSGQPVRGEGNAMMAKDAKAKESAAMATILKGCNASGIGGGIHRLGAFAERIDHAVGDHAEHRADQLLQDDVGEFVVHVEVDLARVGAQGFEAPRGLQHLERAIDQVHLHLHRAHVAVLGGEALLDAMEIDADLRDQLVALALDDFHRVTPRQELGIVLDLGDEVEHLFCAIAQTSRTFANATTVV